MVVYVLHFVCLFVCTVITLLHLFVLTVVFLYLLCFLSVLLHLFWCGCLCFSFCSFVCTVVFLYLFVLTVPVSFTLPVFLSRVLFAFCAALSCQVCVLREFVPRFVFRVSCLHFAQLSPVRYVSSANLSPGLYTLCQDVNPRECVRVSVVSFHFCLSIFPASCLHFIYTPFSYEGVCVLWQCFPSVVSGCKTPACVWELVCFPSIFVCQSFACPVCIFHSSLLSGMCPLRMCPQVCTHCVRM